MSLLVRSGVIITGLLAMAHVLRDERGIIPFLFIWTCRILAFICILVVATAIGIVAYLAGSMLLQFLGWY